MTVQKALVEVASILPGANIKSNQSLVATKEYIIYASSHSIFVYQRRPLIMFVKAIQINTSVIDAITANETCIAVSCSDNKLHFYDLKTFEATREVLLTRAEPPISLEFHPLLGDMIIILYQGDPLAETLGELRQINIVTGESTSLVTEISYALGMTLSPHRSEISIMSIDGSLRMYGIDDYGKIVYERMPLLEDGLRVFSPTSPVMAEISNFHSDKSKSILKLINDTLDSLDFQNKKQMTACKQLSYDPKQSDYFLVAWACGIMGLFSSKTGQAIQLFQPQDSGTKGVVYSRNASGCFYTFDSGILKTWNVSQQKPSRQVRLTTEKLSKMIVAPDEKDVLVLLDEQGQILVVEDGVLVYESDISHSQAVLDLKVISPDTILTASYDGQCRLWNCQAFNGFKNQMTPIVPRFTIRNDAAKNISSELINYQSAVCTVEAEGFIITAFENGYITVFNPKNQQPLNNIFDPNIQVSEGIMDLINFIVDELSTNKLRQKLRPENSKIRSMTYNAGYLYTGWYDGTVRILKLHIQLNHDIGHIVTASYVAAFNIKSLVLGMAPMTELIVTQLQVVDSNLYISCSCGLFLVFDVGNFQRATATTNVKMDDFSVIRSTIQLFTKQRFFCGSMNFKMSELMMINHDPKPNVQSNITNRIFNDICVAIPSQQEIDYAVKSGTEPPAKIVHLVDNMGILLTMVQLGASPVKMQFKLMSLHVETFSETDPKKTDKNLGLKFVKLTSMPAVVIVGGAEGKLFLHRWMGSHKSRLLARLKSTKSDFSCCDVSGNMVYAGCYDGSVKAITWQQSGFGQKNLLRQYIKCAQENSQVDKEIMSQYFDSTFYLIPQFESILNGQTQPYDAFTPLTTDQYLIKATSALMLATSQLCSATATDSESMLSHVHQRIKQFTQANSVKEAITNLQQVFMSDIDLINTTVVLNKPINKLRIQTLFRQCLQIGACMLDFRFVSELLWQFGLHYEAVQVSCYESKEFYSVQARRLFRLKLKEGEHQESSAQRWDLAQFFDNKLLELIQELSSLKQQFDPVKYNLFIVGVMNSGNFLAARLSSSVLRAPPECQHTITHAISDFYCACGQPMQATLYYLVEMMHDQAIKLLLLSGEYYFAIYLLTKLSTFEKFNGLKLALLAELSYKNLNQQDMAPLFDVIDAHNTAIIDPTGLFFDSKLTIEQFMVVQDMSYDNSLANKAKALVMSKRYNIQENYIDICHLIRKMICVEQQNGAVDIGVVPEEEVEYLNNGVVCKDTYFFITKLLSDVELKLENVKELAFPISYVSKHFALTSYQSEETLATKQPNLHKLFIAGAALAARTGSQKATRSFLASALRAVRKFGCEELEILQSFQGMGMTSSYEFLRGEQRDSVFAGRSHFEVFDIKYFTLFGAVSKYFEWVRGWFE